MSEYWIAQKRSDCSLVVKAYCERVPVYVLKVEKKLERGTHSAG